MKLKTARRSLIANSTMGNEEFTVQANAHMMEILSGLYSDIPWAIVREYGTNMLDGYIALPEDAKITPPQIHIPTILEPYIEFKDFGVGMDFNTVWKVFKTYGASTKTGNNEEVGGFGLGAKTAFCYEGCDSWTVESRFNGKRMLFSATRNEKGVPTLFHLATVDTDEPSGVTVKVPISQRDLRAFKNAVTRLLQFYPLTVKTTGDKTIKVKKTAYIVKGKEWGLRKGQNSNVVMGNVPYPLDLHQIKSKNRSLGRSLGGFALDIRVPVGAVDIVPSREALKYTERTGNYIASVLKAFYEEVSELIQKEIESQPDAWSAIKYLKGNNTSIPISLLVNPGQVQWHGKALDLGNGIKFDYKEIKKAYPDAQAYSFSAKRNYSYSHTTHTTKTKITNIKGGSSVPLGLDEKQSKVFIDDLSKGTAERIGAFFAQEDKGNGYGYSSTIAYLVRAKGLTEKKLKEILGGYPVSLASTLPEPKEKSEEVYLYQVNNGATHNPYRYDRYEPVKVDTGKEAYYIKSSSNETEQTIVNYALKNKLLNSSTPVYRLLREQKALEKLDNWKDLTALVKTHVKKLIEKDKEAFHDYTVTKSNYRGELWADFLTSIKTKLSEDSLAFKAASRLGGMQKRKNSFEKLLVVAKVLKIKLPESADSGFDLLTKELESSYPMLKIFFQNHFRANREHEEAFIDYMKTMDEKREAAVQP